MEAFRRKVDMFNKKLDEGNETGKYNIHNWLDDYYAAYIERMNGK